MSLKYLNFAVVIFAGSIGYSTIAEAQGGKKSADNVEPVMQCPGSVGSASEPFACECAPGQGESGSVWGSGPYTTDSSLCRAAIHAGGIGVDGGVINVVLHPGQDSYEGSTSNGVETDSWASYGSSFDINSAGGTMAMSDLPTCGTIPDGEDMYACSCPANPVIRSVWGSDPYTADSDICSAAIHASYIERGEGGDLAVLRVQGLTEYRGSEESGVTSSDWGGYESSIVFDWNQ